jgi:hypothetical protein
MDTNNALHKSILYIAIQIAALWSIFLQLTLQSENGKMEVVGLVMLTGLFLIYAHKTIQTLKSYTQRDDEQFA